jgi:amino acid transporter
MSFSSLLATLAAEFDYWHAFESRGVHAGFVFLAVPVTLVAVNMLRIEVSSITANWLNGTILIVCVVIRSFRGDNGIFKDYVHVCHLHFLSFYQ